MFATNHTAKEETMDERELTEEQKALQEEMRALQIMMDPTLRPQSISSAALMEQDCVPVDFVVKGLLPKGLCILGGAPKIGKSWMVLDLCYHVAKGEPFLGLEVNQGTVWYLSYEDNNDRMKRRLACIGADGLDNFHISTREHNPGTRGNGLPETIDRFMRDHRDTKLIVIDTMQMAKGTSKDPQYGGDYADTGAFKDLADKYNVALVLVHHLRKAVDSDPFNEFSGSTGITGAADTLISLKKSARMGDAATFRCTGRDVDQREMELRFDRKEFHWNKLSDSADLDTIPLPPEIEKFVGFVRSIQYFDGTNTALAERFYSYCGIDIGPKVLKQKMNRWSNALTDLGICFHSYSTNESRKVTVTYTPPTAQTTQITQTVCA